jgi:hypothetical protein
VPLPPGFTDDYAIWLEAKRYTAADLLKAATFEDLVDVGLQRAHARYVCSRGGSRGVKRARESQIQAQLVGGQGTGAAGEEAGRGRQGRT